MEVPLDQTNRRLVVKINLRWEMMCVKGVAQSHGQSFSYFSYQKYSSHTGVATLLDALSPVRDASGRVS